jgi:hypothetical protein
MKPYAWNFFYVGALTPIVIEDVFRGYALATAVCMIAIACNLLAIMHYLNKEKELNKKSVQQ